MKEGMSNPRGGVQPCGLIEISYFEMRASYGKLSDGVRENNVRPFLSDDEAYQARGF